MRLNSSVSRKLSLVVLTLAGIAAGCTDFSTTPPSLGRVLVSVKDENNAGVGQLVADLLLEENKSTIWRSLRTSSDGSGEFGKPDGGVIAQDYVVRLATGGEYLLGDGETNDKPVTAVVSQTQTVSFRVKKRVVDPTPVGDLVPLRY